MNEYDVKRMALIYATQAEIEGMKAFNIDREQNGMTLAYDDAAFQEKAEELRNIANCHNEQL